MEEAGFSLYSTGFWNSAAERWDGNTNILFNHLNLKHVLALA